MSKLARETGVEEQAREVTPWNHVVSLVWAQLSRSVGLNDVCDSLQLHSGPLSTIRGAKAPSKNGLSHANRTRSAEMAEQLFYRTLEHLQSVSPQFAKGRSRRWSYRFKRPIHVLDTTVIELVANCMDWAKHRRRKAAAKLHMRLDLRSLLPHMALVGTAAEHDNRRAREMCADLKAGEIVLFDRGYIDFTHLYELDARGVFWVTRAKENMACEVVTVLPVSDPKIVADEIVRLTSPGVKAPEIMRRVIAWVIVDGEERLMTFLTNHLSWSPRSVADLYRCRWQIEAFFKQIKQTLQLVDFLGHNANAVRWQIWTALLTYLLLHYLSFLSNWAHSFTRLFTILRSVLWSRYDLLDLFVCYGTAGGNYRNLTRPEQPCLKGFD